MEDAWGFELESRFARGEGAGDEREKESRKSDEGDGAVAVIRLKTGSETKKI